MTTPTKTELELEKITSTYAWQFDGVPRVAVPAHWLELIQPLFSYVDTLIQDEFERMMFSWTDIKVHQDELAIYYICQEEHELELEPMIEQVREACKRAGVTAPV